jgi:glycosyltransferase involved in cell wall biosynthesis
LTGPLVSVVLVVRDGERYIGEAIESVLAQDYRPIELVVVDDGSSDGTRRVARAFPDVRFLESAGRGIAAALNTGVAAARGDFVAFIAHDDLWAEGKLAEQMACLLAHPETAYTIGHLRFFLEPGCTLPPGYRPDLLDRDHVGRLPETLVARRSAFARVGPFDDRYAVANDVDWFARAQDLGLPMAVIPRVLLHKRMHGTNNTTHAARENTRELLSLLRASIARRRDAPAS